MLKVPNQPFNADAPTAGFHAVVGMDTVPLSPSFRAARRLTALR